MRIYLTTAPFELYTTQPIMLSFVFGNRIVLFLLL